jgi:hypothetical protein
MGTLASAWRRLVGELFEFEWDDAKDTTKRRQYGFGFQEAVRLVDGPVSYDDSDCYPLQYRITGFVPYAGDLFTLACEDRRDASGQTYTHVATFWRSGAEERKIYEEEHPGDC